MHGIEHVIPQIICLVLSANRSADHEAFGSQLRGGRLSATLSREELTGRSGVCVLAISDWERGRTRWPRPDTVGRRADALELDGGRDGVSAAAGAASAAAVDGLGAHAGPQAGPGVRYSLLPGSAVTGRRAELGRVAAAVVATTGTGRVPDVRRRRALEEW